MIFDILNKWGHRVDMQNAADGNEAMSKYHRDCNGIKALRPKNGGIKAIVAPLNQS